MTETPNWLQPGTRVASVQDRNMGRSIRYATIERVGKRDVVLDNGERFNVQRLTRDEGGTWGWTVMLLSADDPFVAKLAADIARDRLIYAARAACQRFINGERETTAFDVVLALGPLTGVADQIAALEVPRHD